MHYTVPTFNHLLIIKIFKKHVNIQNCKLNWKAKAFKYVIVLLIFYSFSFKFGLYSTSL